MLAPERFAIWMSGRVFTDKKFGLPWRYHPRSDEHSVVLCDYVLEDLLTRSPKLKQRVTQGVLAHGHNILVQWNVLGRDPRQKKLDLAVGTAVPQPMGKVTKRGAKTPPALVFSDVLIASEAKAVMTEHSKAKPRVFDELNSSHQIVHAEDDNAISTGIAVVNIAQTFISPTDQAAGQALNVAKHTQPHAAAAMVNHLMKLPIRDQVGAFGFEAFAIIVIDCDNDVPGAKPTKLWTNPPAPQPGDLWHYETFLDRIVKFYDSRFP